MQTLRRAVEVMQAQLTDARLSLYRPDVLLRPALGDMDLLAFHRRTHAVKAGTEAARTALPELRRLDARPDIIHPLPSAARHDR